MIYFCQRPFPWQFFMSECTQFFMSECISFVNFAIRYLHDTRWDCSKLFFFSVAGVNVSNFSTSKTLRRIQVNELPINEVSISWKAFVSREYRNCRMEYNQVGKEKASVNFTINAYHPPPPPPPPPIPTNIRQDNPCPESAWNHRPGTLIYRRRSLYSFL